MLPGVFSCTVCPNSVVAICIAVSKGASFCDKGRTCIGVIQRIKGQSVITNAVVSTQGEVVFSFKFQTGFTKEIDLIVSDRDVTGFDTQSFNTSQTVFSISINIKLR